MFLFSFKSYWRDLKIDVSKKTVRPDTFLCTCICHDVLSTVICLNHTVTL